MNQHSVEIGTGATDDLAPSLGLFGCDHDIPQRAQHERPWPARTGRLDQRLKLEAEGAASKRKSLDDDGVGVGCCKCPKQGGAPRRAQGVVDRPPAGVDKVSVARIARSDRRQLNYAFGGDAGQLRQRLATRNQCNSDPFAGQCIDEINRPPQMPDPEQVLNVE